MEAGYLTNFIPNITAPNSKHFTFYQLNKGLPSAGQSTWLHNLKSRVQVFFSALKNVFNIGTYQRTNMSLLIYTDTSAIGQYYNCKPIYRSGPTSYNCHEQVNELCRLKWFVVSCCEHIYFYCNAVSFYSNMGLCKH